MCLEIIASIDAIPGKGVGARRLSRETGLRVTKVRFEERPALHFAVSGPCSCEFLPDAYDSEVRR